MTGGHPLFRPPGEADSLILRVADGCPWNRCAFCGMYAGVAYRPVPPERWRADLETLARLDPQAGRVFLADGDAMALPMERILEVLDALHRRLPRLARVGMYANGDSILARTDEDLRTLRGQRVHTLYLGLESGSAAVLRAARKRETPDRMVRAGVRAQAAGLRLSVMVLIGLGGRDGSAEHVRGTVEALNAMQPRLLSFLRVVPVPGTPLAAAVRDGSFRELSEAGAAAEMRALLAGLDLRATVFRADHVSNSVPLAGNLPGATARLLAELDGLLAPGVLDAEDPGPRPPVL